MNQVFASAVGVQAFCDARRWPFCIIGGLAVHRWGEVRVTNDVDVTLLTGLGQEETYVEQWLREFAFRPPCDLPFAVRNRVLLLVNRLGVNIDIALGATDFERRSIQRSSIWVAGGLHPLRTCSAEDLVVHKCFANRDRDWVDVDGILARQGKLNVKLIRRELKPLADLREEPAIMARLEKLIRRHRLPFKIIKPWRT